MRRCISVLVNVYTCSIQAQEAATAACRVSQSVLLFLSEEHGERSSLVLHEIAPGDCGERRHA